MDNKNKKEKIKKEGKPEEKSESKKVSQDPSIENKKKSVKDILNADGDQTAKEPIDKKPLDKKKDKKEIKQQDSKQNDNKQAAEKIEKPKKKLFAITSYEENIVRIFNKIFIGK